MTTFEELRDPTKAIEFALNKQRTLKKIRANIQKDFAGREQLAELFARQQKPVTDILGQQTAALDKIVESIPVSQGLARGQLLGMQNVAKDSFRTGFTLENLQKFVENVTVANEAATKVIEDTFVDLISTKNLSQDDSMRIMNDKIKEYKLPPLDEQYAMELAQSKFAELYGPMYGQFSDEELPDPDTDAKRERINLINADINKRIVGIANKGVEYIESRMTRKDPHTGIIETLDMDGINNLIHEYVSGVSKDMIDKENRDPNFVKPIIEGVGRSLVAEFEERERERERESIESEQFYKSLLGDEYSGDEYLPEPPTTEISQLHSEFAKKIRDEAEKIKEEEEKKEKKEKKPAKKKESAIIPSPDPNKLALEALENASDPNFKESGRTGLQFGEVFQPSNVPVKQPKKKITTMEDILKEKGDTSKEVGAIEKDTGGNDHIVSGVTEEGVGKTKEEVKQDMGPGRALKPESERIPTEKTPKGYQSIVDFVKYPVSEIKIGTNTYEPVENKSSGISIAIPISDKTGTIKVLEQIKVPKEGEEGEEGEKIEFKEKKNLTQRDIDTPFSTATSGLKTLIKSPASSKNEALKTIPVKDLFNYYKFMNVPIDKNQSILGSIRSTTPLSALAKNASYKLKLAMGLKRSEKPPEGGKKAYQLGIGPSEFVYIFTKGQGDDDAQKYVDFVTLVFLDKAKNSKENTGQVEEKMKKYFDQVKFEKSNKDKLNSMIQTSVARYLANFPEVVKGGKIRQRRKLGPRSAAAVGAPMIYKDMKEVIGRGKLLEAALDAGNTSPQIPAELVQIYDFLYKNSVIPKHIYKWGMSEYSPK
jgi:hypothetical protein